MDWHYGLSLVRRCLRGKRRFSCYDMLMTVAPGMLLTLAAILLNSVFVVVCLTQPAYIARQVLSVSVDFMLSSVVNFYLGLLLYGLLTTLSEWDKIRAGSGKKILFVFTFPLFMFTYVPIALSALVRRVSWKPIQHGCTGVEEVVACSA